MVKIPNQSVVSFMNIILIFLVVSLTSLVNGMNLHEEIDLSGQWRFEIGDNMEYIDPNFDDSHWARINIPNAWENEGFPGYDGYGWYRKSFVIPKNLQNEVLFLKLGRVDDVDMVYINGEFLGGQGSFPPEYKTAYDVKRIYVIPLKRIIFGAKNILAVRVFDEHGAGGIIGKKVGIYSRTDILNLEITLTGNWKFKTDDDTSWAKPDFNDSKWQQIQVPSTWEKQGYPKHDGFAWYRREVIIPERLSHKKIILMLGRINDLDETYFNGEKIGSMGEFPEEGRKRDNRNYYKRERAYFIPSNLIHFNKKNIIAVRVYDVGNKGGIYEGYIGITTREEYLKYTPKRLD